MKTPDAEKWETLARNQGHFPVLAHDGALRVAASHDAGVEFFETGEADLASLLSVVASTEGGEASLTAALDFGCGAGRLTLPIARRASTVTACDISPTMLVRVLENARKAGLANVTGVTPDQLTGTFSFICSLLVLQYVPRAAGYAILRALLRLLAPGGVALLHVLLAPSGESLRQLIRVNRKWFGRNSLLANTPVAADELPLYAYDELVVLREIEAAGAHLVGRVIADAGAMRGAVLIVRRLPTAAKDL